MPEASDRRRVTSNPRSIKSADGQSRPVAKDTFLTTAPRAPSQFRLQDYALTVYIPTILFSIGQGAVIPIVPLLAKDLGASVAVAGLVVAIRAIGQLLFNVPAGIAVSRWGDRFAMIAGSATVAVVAVAAAFSSSVAVLAVLNLAMGGGWAFWGIARLSYLTEVAPPNQRGRAMSMVGGMNRLGNFIGPMLGGILASMFGLESAFILQAVMGGLAAAVMFISVRPQEDVVRQKEQLNVLKTFADNRSVLGLVGPGYFLLSVLRQVRLVFLPLWGDSIGLSVREIGFATGMSFFIDTLVFYPAGSVTDRHGRRWASVPTLLTLAVSLAILPLANSLSVFMVVALISGVGNGFGTGIGQTLGADFAPAVGRGAFLGLWRLIGDTGQAAGPLGVSVLTALTSLAVAAETAALVGLGGAALMAFVIPETLTKTKKTDPG